MHDWDRTAPIALPRHAPVAQAVLRGRLARALAVDALDHLGLGLFDRHIVQEPRVDQAAGTVIGLVTDGERVGVLILGADHGGHHQIVFPREVQIALVMRRTAEHRAGAIAHQDEVRDIDRQFPAVVERMHDADAGIEALLLGGLQRFLGGAQLAALGVEGGDLGIAFQRLGQRVVAGNRGEACTEQRVGAGGVDLQLVEIRGSILGLEAEFQAGALADPVLLHQADFFGPFGQRVDGLQQFLGIVTDAEKPLCQLLALDQRARAPAASALDLFVGQNRHVDRVPVDGRFLAINQTLFHHVDEHGLLLAVILRIAGRQFARPVDRQAHRLQLRPHVRDILIGPVAGVHAFFHGGVLGRHAEGVPAHRVQHVEAARRLVPRHHVAHGIVADMAHVDAARRIGKHLQHIVFIPCVVGFGLEDLRCVPCRLPFRLDDLGIVPRHIPFLIR